MRLVVNGQTGKAAGDVPLSVPRILLAVLVGLSVYLPFIYIATYGVGCVLNMFTTMSKGRRFTEEWGVPLAAGLIVGEAVPALIVNIIILGQG